MNKNRMKKIKIKFRIIYLIILVIIFTICIFLFNPLYLFEKGKYFQTEYMRYHAADHYMLLNNDPDFDILYVNNTEIGFDIILKNFETNNTKQVTFPGYSTNPFLGGYYCDLYLDEDDHNIYIVISDQQANYYLLEAYNNEERRTKQTYKILHLDIFDELQKESICFDGKELYPSYFDNSEDDLKISKYKNGFKIAIHIDKLATLKRTHTDDVPENDLYISICRKINQQINTKLKPAALFELTSFFYRNSYYRKTFFDKPYSDERGFVGSRILGKVDADHDGIKEYIIHFKGGRWLKELMICYDKEEDKVLWEREFVYGLNNNQNIIDIDNDGNKEIIVTSTAYCNEYPADWFRCGDIGESCYSRFMILNNKGEIKKINRKEVSFYADEGLNSLSYYPVLEKSKILIAYNPTGDRKKREILLYDIKTNEIDTTNIEYTNIQKFVKTGDDLIAYDNTENILIEIHLNDDLQVIDRIERKFDKKDPLYPKRLLIRDKEYLYLFNPFRIFNSNMKELFRMDIIIADESFSGVKNVLYFTERKGNVNYLSSLRFNRNYTINPYVMIIFLVEFMVLMFYFLIKQYLKIPIESATSSYFIVYDVLGKLHFWKLIGRMKEMKEINKPHKKMYPDNKFAEYFINEYVDNEEPIYKKNFLLFKYNVYEIKSADEFPIIQSISHDLKNRSMLAKLSIENYVEELEQKAKVLMDETLTIVTDISNIARKLSIFARINKLHKEKIGIKSLIESIIEEYINHPLYDKIEFCPVTRSKVEVSKVTEDTSFDYFEEEESTQNDILIFIDVTQFKSAFENLLNNALEEIDENGYIKIYVKKEKDEVIIEMRNSMSQDSTRTAFPVESCLERGFSTKGSSGLGVPIAKTIVEKHGGIFEIDKTEKEFAVRIIFPAKHTK